MLTLLVLSRTTAPPRSVKRRTILDQTYMNFINDEHLKGTLRIRANVKETFMVLQYEFK